MAAENGSAGSKCNDCNGDWLMQLLVLGRACVVFLQFFVLYAMQTWLMPSFVPP